MNETQSRSACAAPPREASHKPGPGDYIWLAYSLFFLIEPAVRGQALYWLENIAIYLAFIAVYALFHRARTQRQQVVLLGVMGAIGLASIPFNTGGTSFCIFAAGFLPFVIASEATVIVTLAIGLLLLLGECLRIHMDWINTTIAIGMSVVVSASNAFIAQKKRANERLVLAHEEIERIAAVAERERIARDLHDVLGHTLSVIVLKAELAGRLIERDPQAAAKEISEVESTARAALSEVREAIGGYRTRGLHAEIEQARRTLNAADVNLHCELPADAVAFTPTEETVLSLAVREAVTNIVRHARAATCTLLFAVQADGSRILLVEDDGSSKHLPREGNGLRGMRERVQALGGELTIRAGSSQGTALCIEIPSPRALSAASSHAGPSSQ